jgi:hypothetical protein
MNDIALYKTGLTDDDIYELYTQKSNSINFSSDVTSILSSAQKTVVEYTSSGS